MKTKPMITAAVLLLLSCSPIANAQVTFGTRHGVSISTCSKVGDLYDNDELSSGYSGGVFVQMPLYKGLSLRPEINYIRKGRSFDGNVSAILPADYHYDYLQIPVLARYSFDSGSKHRLFLGAGFYGAALLNTDVRLKNSREEASSSPAIDKDPDFGLIFGGGVAVPVGKLDLEFDLRYDMGLVDLPGMPENYCTKALTLAAGIRF